MAADRDIQGVGYQVKVRTGTFMKKVQEKIEEALPETADQFLERVRANISLTDHDLKELRRLGHPYGLHASPVHGDDRLVHIQSGKLKKSLKRAKVEKLRGNKFQIMIYSTDPKIPWLLFGTQRMRPRRFHEKALNEMRGRLWNKFFDRLKGIQYRLSTERRWR